MKNSYSPRERKIYEDYSAYNNEQLLGFAKNKEQFQEIVYVVILDILAERGVNDDSLVVPTAEPIATLDDAPKKERHVVVSIYLYVVMTLNAIVFFTNLFNQGGMMNLFPGKSIPPFVIFTIILNPVVNILLIALLLDWKRWAFSGLIIITIIAFLANLWAGSFNFLGLLGLGILYGVLQIKRNDVSAWDNLS